MGLDGCLDGFQITHLLQRHPLIALGVRLGAEHGAIHHPVARLTALEMAVLAIVCYIPSEVSKAISKTKMFHIYH